MDARENPAGPGAAGPFGGAELAFPVTFDLRIIYLLAGGESIQADLELLFERMSVPCSLMQGLAAPGAKYGRFGCRVTLDSRERMYALYAELGKLPYVKAAI